jgi:heptosyltransferase II
MNTLKRFFVQLLEARRHHLPDPALLLDFSDIHRILIVRQHDQLGDLLISTPAIRAVRKRFPLAAITLVVREYTAPLAEHNPNIDHLLVFSENLRQWSIGKLRTFWRGLRANGGFDCAIVLNTVSRSFSSDMIAVLSGARYLVGPDLPSYDSSRPERIYNVIARRSPQQKTEIERNIDIVRVLGADENNWEYDLVLTETEDSEGLAIYESLNLSEGMRVLGVHFGGENPAKCLPLETLAAVIDESVKRFDCQVMLVRGPHEEARLQALERLVHVPVSVAPVMPLRIVAALIRRCNLFICNDTGALHIASSQRVPTISFHAISDPAVWKPVHPRHRAIKAEGGKIEKISAEAVMEEIQSVWG